MHEVYMIVITAHEKELVYIDNALNNIAFKH